MLVVDDQSKPTLFGITGHSWLLIRVKRLVKESKLIDLRSQHQQTMRFSLVTPTASCMLGAAW